MENYVKNVGKLTIKSSENIFINGNKELVIEKNGEIPNKVTVVSKVTDIDIDFNAKYKIEAFSKDNVKVGQLNIISGNPHTIKITPVYLDGRGTGYRDGSDMKPTDIENWLNIQSHNQLFVKWRLLTLEKGSTFRLYAKFS